MLTIGESIGSSQSAVTPIGMHQLQDIWSGQTQPPRLRCVGQALFYRGLPLKSLVSPVGRSHSCAGVC